MSIYLKAVLVSIFAHSFIALAVWIGHPPSRDLPVLNPSAVEISFSVIERETPLVSDTPLPPQVSDTPPSLVSDTPQLPLVSDTPPSPLVSDTLPPLVSDTPPSPLVSDTPPPQVSDTLQSPLVSDTPPPLVSDTPPRGQTVQRFNGPTVQRFDGPTVQRFNGSTVQRLNDPASAPAPKQAKVDAPPRLLKTIRPDYPTGARKRGQEGDVDLELAVNACGGVDSVDVLASSGHPDLDAAAVRAATKARFVPATAGENAISSVARITISFRLTAR